MRLIINKPIEIVSQNTNKQQSDLLQYVLTDLNDVLKKYNIWFECKMQPDRIIIVIADQKIILGSIDINYLVSVIDDMNLLMQSSDEFNIKMQYLSRGPVCDLCLEMSIEKLNVMTNKLYKFATVRGADFVIEGNDPKDAWLRLIEREKNNGSLWKTGDKFRNEWAVVKQGFSYLYPERGSSSCAYKEITQN